MRSFVVICTLSFVLAVPQYDYSISKSEQTAELHQLGELSSSAQQTTQNLAGSQSQFGQNHQPGPSINNNQNSYQQNNYQSMPQNHANGLTQSSTGLFSGNSVPHAATSQPHQNAIITKEIYIHAAPEETAEEIAEQEKNIRTPRKHYRVIFIKTPSGSIKSAALRLAQTKNEEKTIIYVLSKKEDGVGPLLSAGAGALPLSKPEVYFIKYKTPEEARHAQNQIRAEYDALGGTTHVTDEGVAPIQSFIGALDNVGINNHQNNPSQSGVGSLGASTLGNLGHDFITSNIGSLNSGNNYQSSFKSVSGSIDSTSGANSHQAPINSAVSSVRTPTGGFPQPVPIKSISRFLGTSVENNFHHTPVKAIPQPLLAASGGNSHTAPINSAAGFLNTDNRGYQYQTSAVNGFQNSGVEGKSLLSPVNSFTGNQNTVIQSYQQKTPNKSFLDSTNLAIGGNIHQSSFNSNFGPTNTGAGNNQQQTPAKSVNGFADTSPGSSFHQASLNTIIGGHLNLVPINSFSSSSNTATGGTQNFANGGNFNQVSTNPVFGLANSGNGGYQNQVPANSVNGFLDTANGNNFRNDPGKSDSNSLNPAPGDLRSNSDIKVDSAYIDQLINLVFGNQNNGNGTRSDEGEHVSLDSVNGSNSTDPEDDRIHAIDIRSAVRSYM